METNKNVFNDLISLGELIKELIRGQNAFIQIISESELGCKDPEERIKEVLSVFSTMECIVADCMEVEAQKSTTPKEEGHNI